MNINAALTAELTAKLQARGSTPPPPASSIAEAAAAAAAIGIEPSAGNASPEPTEGTKKGRRRSANRKKKNKKNKEGGGSTASSKSNTPQPEKRDVDSDDEVPPPPPPLPPGGIPALEMENLPQHRDSDAPPPPPPARTARTNTNDGAMTSRGNMTARGPGSVTARGGNVTARGDADVAPPPPPRKSRSSTRGSKTMRKVISESDIIRVQRQFRKFLSQNRFKRVVNHAMRTPKVRERSSRRFQVLKEILTTEKTYVQGLETVLKLYVTPLLQGNLLQDMQLKTIFSQLQTIEIFNKNFLQSLEKRWNDQHKWQQVGDIFCEMSPYMKMYTQYVNYTEQSFTAMSNAVKRNKKFAEFLAKRLKDPESGGLDLGSYLIMPVQRIPRYELLLRQLLSLTPEDHQDYQSIEKALAEIQSIATYINDAKRKADNMQKVLSIQTTLTGDFDNLVEPHREYVFDGALQKVSKNNLELFPRHFFLFSDCIVYAKQTYGDKYQVKMIHRIEKGAGVLEMADNQRFKNAFVLMLKSDLDYTMCASSPQEREQWVSKLNQVIKAVKDKASQRLSTGQDNMQWEKVSFPIQVAAVSWHATVIYMDKLYVFGGCDGKGWFGNLSTFNLNTFAYDSTDVDGSSPFPRYGHTADLYGNRVLIFGGKNDSGTFHSDLYDYNLDSKEWNQISIQAEHSHEMTPSLAFHSSSLIEDTMYIFGGSTQTDPCKGDLYRLCLSTGVMGSVEANGTAPGPRLNHTSTKVGSNIFIIGGMGQNRQPLADVFVLDTTSVTWSQPTTALETSVAPVARYGHSATLVGPMVYVFGGQSSEDRYLDDVQLLETATMSWFNVSTSGNPSKPRSHHTANLMSQNLYVYGGNLGPNAASGTMHILHTIPDARKRLFEELKGTGIAAPVLFQAELQDAMEARIVERKGSFGRIGSFRQRKESTQSVRSNSGGDSRRESLTVPGQEKEDKTPRKRSLSSGLQKGFGLLKKKMSKTTQDIQEVDEDFSDTASFFSSRSSNAEDHEEALSMRERRTGVSDFEGGDRLTVKCKLEELRVIQFTRSTTVNELFGQIEREFGRNVIVSYCDQDGDTVMIKKQSDYNQFLRAYDDAHRRNPGTAMRLTVTDITPRRTGIGQTPVTDWTWSTVSRLFSGSKCEWVEWSNFTEELPCLDSYRPSPLLGHAVSRCKTFFKRGLADSLQGQMSRSQRYLVETFVMEALEGTKLGVWTDAELVSPRAISQGLTTGERPRVVGEYVIAEDHQASPVASPPLLGVVKYRYASEGSDANLVAEMKICHDINVSMNIKCPVLGVSCDGESFQFLRLVVTPSLDGIGDVATVSLSPSVSISTVEGGLDAIAKLLKGVAVSAEATLDKVQRDLAERKSSDAPPPPPRRFTENDVKPVVVTHIE